MRVFNIYRFNIADKVKFKDAQSYIQNMLAELGLGWSDLAFAASTVSGDRTISNVLEKLPKLKKYFKSAEDEPMICSYTENWSSGEIFADKSDYDDIFAVFSKIPRPFNIPFGHVLLSAVTCHGRTRTQFYSGKADWDIIKQVKGAVKIPVIGNGDVVDGESAKAMYEQTGCDLVMIGRGSYGRPWVFRDVKHYLETGEKLPEVSIEEKMAVMKKHCELICKYKGERQGMKEARKNCAWYVKGLKGSARLRAQCGGLNTISDLYEMIDHILANELGE